LYIEENRMVALSISVEAWTGLTWPRWKRLVTQVERLGFTGLYCSDHFIVPPPPAREVPELSLLLAYLADHTQRVHFGQMVSPLSFRDPVLLARQAVALDDLSAGRMILGVGAGWNEEEHVMYGYDLGDVPTRMARFEEGLEVITRLMHGDEPASYTGRFFRLQDAVLRLPRPKAPPILIGGSGPKRTLPLVARFADIWNGQGLTPDGFRERSAQLDELLHGVARQPSDVKRTYTTPVVCGRNTAELEQRVHAWREGVTEWANLPLNDLLDIIRDDFKGIVGPPEAVVEQIKAYGAAGVEELICMWGNADIEGLQLLAEQVVPYL
jgi:alkanesulfonate monooxygenase SsuD/methylene tetrahydromethanopterin reductase-like flavin-dependent oxidoreductase (luciferase family)